VENTTNGIRIEKSKSFAKEKLLYDEEKNKLSARRAWPFSACARAENTLSQSTRPRFTEEDTKLVDLKERRGWSWEDIQRSLPGMSTGSLQVRSFTKLKGRNTAS
jgi:hypothetical protein